MTNKVVDLKHHFADCENCSAPIYAGEDYIDLSFYRCKVIKVDGAEHGLDFETEVKEAESILCICNDCSNKVEYKRTVLKSCISLDANKNIKKVKIPNVVMINKSENA